MAPWDQGGNLHTISLLCDPDAHGSVWFYDHISVSLHGTAVPHLRSLPYWRNTVWLPVISIVPAAFTPMFYRPWQVPGDVSRQARAIWGWNSALLTFASIPATSPGSRMRRTSWFGKYPQKPSCPNPVPETILRLAVPPDFFCCCSIDVDGYPLLENQNNNSTNKDSSLFLLPESEGMVQNSAWLTENKDTNSV